MTKQKFNNKVKKLLEKAKEQFGEIEALAQRVADDNNGKIPDHLKAAHEAAGWVAVWLEKCEQISRIEIENPVDAKEVIEPSRIIRP